MPRKMKDQYGEVHVVKEHIILQNCWEYYITDYDLENRCFFAYELGFENGWGWVSEDEIAPYIIKRTKNLRSIMPADNCQWV